MEIVGSAPCLLIATPQLMDPNFHHTVLLLTDHNKNGALGYVVNRPSRVGLCEVLRTPDICFPEDFPVWYGGPVALETGLVLHNQDIANDQRSRTVFSHIKLSSSDVVLGKMAEYAAGKTASSADSAQDSRESHLESKHRGKIKPLYPFRFLVGYAGWGPCQLEEELRLGGWIQVPVSEQVLFSTPWQEMWESAFSTIGTTPLDIAPTTQPYLN